MITAIPVRVKTSRTSRSRGLKSLREGIGAKVRVLRVGRHWSQAELADRLEISQTRLSEIERGLGSFSAEQLLEIFALFNVDAAYFAAAPIDGVAQLHNALAKLGASHLIEVQDVLPSERVRRVNEVVLETLVEASGPRQLAAVGPVLIENIDDLQLPLVEARLAEIGLQHRLGWAVDNTIVALDSLSGSAVGLVDRRRRLRAHVVLSAYAAHARPRARLRRGQPADVLDTTVRSDKGLKELQRSRSTVSKRWGVVSSVGPADFVRAIEASREAA